MSNFDNTPAGVRLRLAREFGGPVTNTDGTQGDFVFWALNEYHEELEQLGWHDTGKGQSRKHSLLEVVTNTALGFVGSWLITYGFVNSDLPNTWVVNFTVIACTVWSIAIGWLIRRSFNRKHLEERRVK